MKNTKNLRVYKLSFGKWTGDEEDLSINQELELEYATNDNIPNQEFFKGFDNDNGDSEEIFVFFPEVLTDNFLNFIEDIKDNDIIKFEGYKEVTNKILYENKYLTKNQMVVEYMKENLDHDDVLDKIKTLGFSNISYVDKEILEDYSKS